MVYLLVADMLDLLFLWRLVWDKQTYVCHLHTGTNCHHRVAHGSSLQSPRSAPSAAQRADGRRVCPGPKEHAGGMWAVTDYLQIRLCESGADCVLILFSYPRTLMISKRTSSLAAFRCFINISTISISSSRKRRKPQVSSQAQMKCEGVSLDVCFSAPSCPND